MLLALYTYDTDIQSFWKMKKAKALFPDAYFGFGWAKNHTTVEQYFYYLFPALSELNLQSLL